MYYIKKIVQGEKIQTIPFPKDFPDLFIEKILQYAIPLCNGKKSILIDVLHKPGKGKKIDKLTGGRIVLTIQIHHNLKIPKAHKMPKMPPPNIGKKKRKPDYASDFD